MYANGTQPSGWYGYRKRLVFAFLCMAALALLLAKKTWVESETAFFQLLDERGEMGVFRLVNSLQYLTIPVVYLAKLTITAFLLWVGCFTFGYRVWFAQCWHVALVAELVFLVPEALKLVWFLAVETDPTLFEVKAFYPLALSQAFDLATVPSRWHYILKALNAFEVAYWYLLAGGLHGFAQKQYRVAWLIVLAAYVSAFVAWLGFYAIVYK